MNILQISFADQGGGGAEHIALSLFQTYQASKYPTWLAVGRKYSHHPDVFEIPNSFNSQRWANFWQKVGNQLSPFIANVRGTWQLQTLLYGIGRPRWWLDLQRGREDFHFPGTWQLLNLLPQSPDIVHCHNLHGGYFDLQALSWLSRQIPTIITLHDAWLLSGHCAHSFDCELWRSGCGHCPDLKIYPPIVRDATDYNWQRKKEIFADSILYVATPSQWLMNKVNESMLMSGVVATRVIPNGVNLSVFSPVDKTFARKELNLPQDAKILLFVANTIRQNIWKDYRTLQNALKQIANYVSPSKLLLLALGEDSPPEEIGSVRVQFVPYQADEQVVARYYQATDLYLHAAKVDTFPTTILEALACGTPVVATAVGGIPEQIKSLAVPGVSSSGYGVNEATGILVPGGNAEAMANAIQYLLNNKPVLEQLGRNAAIDAGQRFSLDKQAKAYLNWYGEILKEWRGNNVES